MNDATGCIVSDRMWFENMITSYLKNAHQFNHFDNHLLRQLRRVRRSLDTESAATLVPASITAMYCWLGHAPKATTDKLQRLLNAAARLLSGTKKFDRGLSQVMHVDLH